MKGDDRVSTTFIDSYDYRGLVIVVIAICMFVV